MIYLTNPNFIPKNKILNANNQINQNFNLFKTKKIFYGLIWRS